MSVPVRRQQFQLAEFATYLAQSGAEVGIPTNVYEVIRYRAFQQGSKKAETHIVYAKENGLLTYTGGSRQHYEAFLCDEGVLAPTKKPAPITSQRRRTIREALRKRDGDCCWYCGGLLESAESNIEHLISRSDGGTNALSNLVMAHTACNTKAGNLPLAKKLELRAKLHKQEQSA